MTELIDKLVELDWFNPALRVQAMQVAKNIDNELANMKRKTHNPLAYQYHKRRLSGLKSRLTRLLHQDANEWFHIKITELGTK